MKAPKGEETIFAEALRLLPEERAAYLAQSTHGNAELRRRVESLLGSYDAGDFLEQAAATQLRPTFHITVPLTEKPGDTIGRYKLLQQIGEGGCGVVYMAEQAEPVRRRVALKIIKLGMDTKSVIARFEAERQAVAMMDHPNIAKVFDAGATETGRPYFVMELVRGMRITEYCDEAKLSTRARLDLFIQVCQAIQHAHQKGIIHRDIKPSNILVTVNDGVPVPKVIDFGIAKATSGQQLTDKTVFTAFEQFIGTPAYMSPEQAVMTSLDIDTRSDIYALGVLLYELLTGKTPFDAKELFVVGLDEMRRTIRETEPPKPSTRVSTLGGDELSTTAHRRGLDPPKFASQLRGDLDWIVMRALEKDRARRYDTANGLAMDIQRHLTNEPVLACPPSTFYRLQKTIRRNKLAFAAGTAVAVALIVGLGMTTWMFLKQREALRRAVIAEQAERKLRQEAELRELKTRALQAGNEPNWENEAAVRRELLDTQRRILGEDHPDVAESLGALARLFTNKRSYSDAEKMLSEAVAIHQKISPEGTLATAQLLEQFARLQDLQQKYPSSEEMYRKTISIRRRILGDNHVDVALTVNSYAVMLSRQGKHSQAGPLYREALATLRRLLGDGDSRVALVLGNSLSALVELGQLDEAQILVRDAMPANIIKSPNLSEKVKQLVKALCAQNQCDKAEKLLTHVISEAPDSIELLKQRIDLRGRFSRFQEASADCARVLILKPDDDEVWHRQAAILAYTGRIDEYRWLSRECLERSEKLQDRVRERAAKAALLLPQPGPVQDRAIRTADQLTITNLNPNVTTWFHFAKGMADYRARRFEGALEHMRIVLMSSNPNYYADREAGARSIIAMAKVQMGRVAEANEELTTLTIREASMLSPARQGDMGEYGWDDGVRALVLIREARALIEGDSKNKSSEK